MRQPTFKDLTSAVDRRDYKIFTDGPHDLNIIGVRTRDTKANTFNDWLGVFGIDKGGPGQEEYGVGTVVPCTTDPGQYWRDNPPDIRGAAILLPGQYRGFFEIRNHQGKYPALCQRVEGTYWRIPANWRGTWRYLYSMMMLRDSDGTIPTGVTETYEIIGSNLHRASETRKSTQVDKWSAACQVVPLYFHFDMIMAMARGQRDMGGGRSFTYTLLMEDYV